MTPQKRSGREGARAAKRSPMICPDCGREMNYHAEKLADPIDAAEAARVDTALGGLIREIHTCPECGRSDSRTGH